MTQPILTEASGPVKFAPGPKIRSSCTPVPRRRSLVEDTVMKLPAKYRVVVVLRDMEQLSTEETAAALGLGIPAVKSRLIRGRMMVREALAPHFSKPAKGVTT